MSEQTVTLDASEWQQVMNALIAANPLLMKIAEQLRMQQSGPPSTPVRGDGKDIGKEQHHE
jgi:hypothetical protein